MAIYANTEVQAVADAGGLQLNDFMIMPSGQVMSWDGSRWNPSIRGTTGENYYVEPGHATTSGLRWNGNGGFVTENEWNNISASMGNVDPGSSVVGGGNGTTNDTTNQGTTSTTGGSPVTMADFIRNVESQTLQGRRNVFDRYADAQAFGRFLNPLARSVLSRQFDPLSSQYLLASAPTAAGGAAGYNVADAGTGLSFRDFLGGSARPGYTLADGVGAYGDMAGTPVFGTQGTMGMTPWSRSQWQTRIGGLFGTPAEGTTMPTMPTGAAGDFLGALSMGEAANMIANAQTAGLNPILARSAPAGINRAIAAWQEANPEAGAAQLLRSYVGSGNTGGGTPVFNQFVT
jgi:hypothetical protein